MKKIILSVTLWTICLITFCQKISNDTIHWTDNYILTWNDFMGKQENKQGMKGQISVSIEANFIQATSRANVVTVFDRKTSWVKDLNKTDQFLDIIKFGLI